MNLLDLLFNAAGGGVFGSLLHLATSAFETWQLKKRAEVEVMVMNAKVAAAEKEAAWNAFAKSQDAAGDNDLNVPPTVSPLMANVLVAVEALRRGTRPLLTWALLFVLIYVFAVSPQAARESMLGEITFGAFTGLFWWFGSRYARK